MSEPTLKPHPSQGVPGCGYAAYALVLLFFCGVGLFGMTSATLALLQAGATADGPSSLVPGTQVTVWRLQPMRDAKLLGPSDVPAAWHDETLTGEGTRACAMTDTALLRVEDGQGWRMPYERIAAVELTSSADRYTVEARAADGEAIRCFFGPNEGADQLERMLKTEAGLSDG